MSWRAVTLTGRVAILAAREGGEAIKANKIATSVGSVPAKFVQNLHKTSFQEGNKKGGFA